MSLIKPLPFSAVVLTTYALAVGAHAQDESAVTIVPASEPQLAEDAERPAGAPTLTSGLNVPGGETFHLGERQTGEFTVSAKNRGKVPVTLSTLRGKKRQVIGKVAPGEVAVRRFQSGDGVLVRNLSDSTTARLYVEVWGTRNLAMYYKPNAEEPSVETEQ